MAIDQTGRVADGYGVQDESWLVLVSTTVRILWYDDTSDAQAFLSQHPVSYPSYQMAVQAITGIVPQGLLGTPSTIYFNRTGKIVAVHTGQYESQGSLDADIQTSTLGG